MNVKTLKSMLMCGFVSGLMISCGDFNQDSGSMSQKEEVGIQSKAGKNNLQNSRRKHLRLTQAGKQQGGTTTVASKTSGDGSQKPVTAEEKKHELDEFKRDLIQLCTMEAGMKLSDVLVPDTTTSTEPEIVIPEFSYEKSLDASGALIDKLSGIPVDLFANVDKAYETALSEVKVDKASVQKCVDRIFNAEIALEKALEKIEPAIIASEEKNGAIIDEIIDAEESLLKSCDIFYEVDEFLPESVEYLIDEGRFDGDDLTDEDYEYFADEEFSDDMWDDEFEVEYELDKEMVAEMKAKAESKECLAAIKALDEVVKKHSK